MKIVDKGVSQASFMDFSIPSDFARSALYFSPHFGHFYCDSAYQVARDSLDLMLLVYVCGGALHIETQGRSYTARTDEIALLDCRRAHRYYCTDQVDFLWFHFSGAGSGAYVQYLNERFGVVFSGKAVSALRRSFEDVLTQSQGVFVNEHLVSLGIHRILSRLACTQQHAASVNHALYPALGYIAAHFAQPLELDALARTCSMSISHFIRSFKKYAGCTPHEYLLSYRLRQAKELLLSTDDTIERIAEQCGFHSASHFARAFRKNLSMTPSEFRNLRF